MSNRTPPIAKINSVGVDMFSAKNWLIQQQLEEGVATREDLDQAAKLGLGHPMGPLELADLVGLDTLLSICEVFHREFGDPKYRPPVLLRRYVAAGWLGRKTGKGFFDYPTDEA